MGQVSCSTIGAMSTSLQGFANCWEIKSNAKATSLKLTHHKCSLDMPVEETQYQRANHSPYTFSKGHLAQLIIWL